MDSTDEKKVKIYMAPMEGITDDIYRRIHYQIYHNVDRYYTPFIATYESEKYKPRDMQGIDPLNNIDIPLVPQILCNHANQFITLATKLANMGYQEVNLNLGCPSGTVAAKGKGSGFLGRIDQLHVFLEEIFKNTPIPISIKTRIGMETAEEFPALLKMYSEYPVKELIIHPRTRTDFYKNPPNLEAFRYAVQDSSFSLCYNGDLNTKAEICHLLEQFPELPAIMIGRGLVRNPSLTDIGEGNPSKEEKSLSKMKRKKFHDELFNAYQTRLYGDKNLLFKMKELWLYMAEDFTNYEKYLKAIRKSERLVSYESAVDALFCNEQLQE